MLLATLPLQRDLLDSKQQEYMHLSTLDKHLCICRRVVSAAAEVFNSGHAENGSVAAPLITTEDQVMPYMISICLSSVLGSNAGFVM